MNAGKLGTSIDFSNSNSARATVSTVNKASITIHKKGASGSHTPMNNTINFSSGLG